MRKRGIPRRITFKPLEKELGFGRSISANERLMNTDGSFNVVREAINVWDNTYHYLIHMTWGQFFLLALVFFGVMNSLFAALYLCFGIENLSGTTPGSFTDNFLQAFFFSSQTLTTVGYGHISPSGIPSSILASFESFMGLLLFALISGLLYGRFSRPRAHIHYSENMLVAPYKDGMALMFRMVNARVSELIETEVQVLMAFNQRDETGKTTRKFYPLTLEINKISFFSLSWTIVHPLDEKSPISGFSSQELIDANAEFMVLVKGTDETTHQNVFSRHSYTADEFVWNAKFSPIIILNEGTPRVITSQIGKFERMMNDE
ncbi:MAG: ion transporter [Saprospiraceae bacterium]|nr:ion transporter [Saprospiraceae bacterium]